MESNAPVWESYIYVNALTVSAFEGYHYWPVLSFSQVGFASQTTNTHG